MKNKIIILLSGLFIRTLKFIILNVFRLAIIVLAYSIRGIGILSESALSALAGLGNILGVRVCYSSPDENLNFEQRYSATEIDSLVENLPKETKTIQDIADHYRGISYRQARKVKHALDTALSIHRAPGILRA